MHEEVTVAYQLVQQFALMVRERKGGQLDTWLEAVAQSSLQDFHSFAKGIRSDIDAVEAGLILPWSNSPVEGKINKLKSIKRSMYVWPKCFSSLASKSAQGGMRFHGKCGRAAECLDLHIMRWIIL